MPRSLRYVIRGLTSRRFGPRALPSRGIVGALDPLRSLPVFALALGATLVAACRPRPNMCAEAQDCGRASCVAGRCQSDAGPPQVDTASRYIYEPVDLACVREEDPEPTAMPPYCVLGRADSARLLVRYSVPLSDQADVVEAYVVLHKIETVQPDPIPLSLHASRIVGDWRGGSTLAATLPAFEPGRTAETHVGWGDIVRVDVREIVKKWRRRDPNDRGIVIEATSSASASGSAVISGSRENASGMAFAVAPSSDGSARVPSLELYLK
jgi:hypothetical protein